MGRQNYYTGLTFERLRLALFNVFLYDDETMKDWPPEKVKELMETYVKPMQHNFTNPLKGNDPTADTFIEYFIVSDERLGQDHKVKNPANLKVGGNLAYKFATIDLRFVGAEAETWAKSFHHICKRPDVARIFEYLCDGEIYEYVESIIPTVIDYYGVGNSSIAFDLSFHMTYKEYVKIDWKPLNYVSYPPGEVIEGSI